MDRTDNLKEIASYDQYSSLNTKNIPEDSEDAAELANLSRLFSISFLINLFKTNIDL